MSNLSAVLTQLRRQRDQVAQELRRLNEALDAISGLGNLNTRKRRIRHMSVAGRARIVAAQKSRWAKWKRQHKVA